MALSFVGQGIYFADDEAPSGFPQLAMDGIEERGGPDTRAAQNKLRVPMADRQVAAEVLKLPTL